MHLSPILIEEARRSLLNTKLRAAYGHDERAVAKWCADLQEKGSVLPDPLPEIGPACRDPDDDHVLAAAVAGRASMIVTGDKDLLALGAYQGVRILTAREFVEKTAADQP